MGDVSQTLLHIEDPDEYDAPPRRVPFTAGPRFFPARGAFSAWRAIAVRYILPYIRVVHPGSETETAYRRERGETSAKW